MRNACTLLPCFLAMAAHGQWETEVKLQLSGNEDAHRQVHGLAAPLSSDAGVSLEAARALAVSFAGVQGTEVLTGALTPAPAAYTTGMLVTIVPAQANAAGATLDLNGLGPMPIVKGSELPLDSADLPAGAPARLLFKDDRFVVVSNVPKTCPTGYSVVNSRLCIEDVARPPQNFYDANATCSAAGGRMCRFAEWAAACRKIPGFFDTVLEAEWIDSAGNHTPNAKLMGYGSDGFYGEGEGCKYGTHTEPANERPIRCCMNR